MSGAVKRVQVDLARTPFSLDYTLNCGQAFRWERRSGRWEGVADHTFIQIRQTGSILSFQAQPKGVNAQFVRRYFRLDDELPRIYSKIVKDKRIKQAVYRLRGLRLLRQDPWECLISYICATRKNIPAIQNMIENMCTRFGKRIAVESDRQVQAFPTPHDLARASLKELRHCKLGFRAERVKKTSKLISEGDFDLEALRKMPYERAKRELTTLPGVGPKVADCVLLFSLDKLEAFPIDVWMKRIVLDYYPEHFEPSFVENTRAKKSLSPREYDIISSFGRRYFGEYAGYSQEYLFHFVRCRRSADFRLS